MLTTKGLFEMPSQLSTPMQMAYTIPEFVWNALQQQKAQFPFEDPEETKRRRYEERRSKSHGLT
jgi:hypothetical protein